MAHYMSIHITSIFTFVKIHRRILYLMSWFKINLTVIIGLNL